MRCYFCGSKYVDNHNKVKFTGTENGKRRQKTTYICSTCSAMTDDRWIEEQLDWDDGSLKVKGV